MPSLTPDARQFALTSRIMVLSWMGALVLIAAISWFALGTADEPFNASIVHLLIVLVGGLLMHRMIVQFGYSVAPLDPAAGDEANARAARTVWTSRMVLRFALGEAVALLSLAAGFVLPGGLLIVLVGCAVSLALVAVHGWPSRRSVELVAERLESGGARSGLREAFGHDLH